MRVEFPKFPGHPFRDVTNFGREPAECLRSRGEFPRFPRPLLRSSPNLAGNCTNIYDFRSFLGTLLRTWRFRGGVSEASWAQRGTAKWCRLLRKVARSRRARSRENRMCLPAAAAAAAPFSSSERTQASPRPRGGFGPTRGSRGREAPRMRPGVGGGSPRGVEACLGQARH